MPLPFAFPVGFLLGILLARCVRLELASMERPLGLRRPFCLVLGFTALVFAPVVGYFVGWHADWAYLFTVASQRVPAWLDVVLTLLAALQLPIGFAMAASWVVHKRPRTLRAVTGALGAGVAVTGILLRRNLLTSGSYNEFHDGFEAVDRGTDTLARGAVLSWLVLTLGLLWTIYALRSSRDA